MLCVVRICWDRGENPVCVSCDLPSYALPVMPTVHGVSTVHGYCSHPEEIALLIPASGCVASLIPASGCNASTPDPR
ncbi:hypothetical protein SLEP1_g51214 [Rubroshorea leprosula]|uniref:Uncharacterized protein n=1 Tax=Rubroshorea leprosula TaxID=152421 RepID=A0AAV5M2G6_9ROSI|nr:hypothetical protein SLEP1_g51214 [Rubroshorea leprosula]